jgi:hypothetical protein
LKKWSFNPFDSGAIGQRCAWVHQIIYLKFLAMPSMTFKELRRIVAQGEGLHIEFKRKVYYPHKIMREVVAFANTDGGKLIIGVSDDGTINGLKHPDEELYVMRAAFEKFCQPAVPYTLHRVEVPHTQGREVLIFDIPPHSQKPVFLLYDFRRKIGKAYIRTADKSVQASREMRKILKAQNNPQDTLISYGDKERLLLRYLGSHSRINLKIFSEIAQISLWQASEILVNMTLAKIIAIDPQEGGYDYFVALPTET